MAVFSSLYGFRLITMMPKVSCVRKDMKIITCFNSGVGYHKISSYIGLIIEAQGSQLRGPVLFNQIIQKIVQFHFGKKTQ